MSLSALQAQLAALQAQHVEYSQALGGFPTDAELAALKAIQDQIDATIIAIQAITEPSVDNSSPGPGPHAGAGYVGPYPPFTI